MRVPVNEPVITKTAKEYVMDALNSGWVSSAGPYIEKFERAFADYLGVKHAVTVTSGTTALHTALLSVGIGPDDEVIVPDFTMIASVFAVLYTGATPVFIDIEPETYNMDVTQLASKITPKTRVIMPVHIYGHSVDMDPVLEIARKHQLIVLEDAAEAHGALYKGKKCGSMGHVSCFSFYANKIVTTGEGGMLVTNDDAIAAKARTLKDLSHSQQRRFWHEELGYNYRMTNLQAALGLGQLAHIEEFLAHKRWMTAEYEKRLGSVQGLRLPKTKPYAKNVYWMYSVLVEDRFPLRRDALRTTLMERGVDTRDFFASSARQPIIQKLFNIKERFPVSEDVANRGLYLPSGLALTEEQLSYICDQILDIAQHG